MKDQSFYQRHEGLILGGGAVLVVLALWEYIWWKQWVSPLFFSGPDAIAKEFWYEITSPQGTLLS
jgi:NitT/TauT family transport system permease protein